MMRNSADSVERAEGQANMSTGRNTENHNVNVPPDLDSRLHDLVNYLEDQTGIRHAVLGVERLDRSFRWVGAGGVAHPDGTPMTPEAMYWIASVTKLYIAAAVFKLMERGEFELRDRISELLPESLIGGIHRLGGVDYTDTITVQHLLGHSSGLPDYLEESLEDTTSLFEQVLANDRSWTSEDAFRIVREQLTPHFPPQPLDAKRQKIQYSDTNYQILIELIETVTAKSLSAVFAEFFYRPLGLTETAHPEELRDDQHPATLWHGDTPVNLPLAMPCFRDLTSTVADQLRFMRGLVNGEVFDRPVTLHRLMGNWKSFGLPFGSGGAASPSWPIQYGLGATRMKIPRLLTPIKPIPAIMGHTGISGSWLFYCPEKELVLAGGVDQIDAPALPYRFVPRLLRTLGDAGI